MRCLFVLASLAGLLLSCNNNPSQKKEAAPGQVKQYTIAQFYKSSEVFGGDICVDDKRMLVSSNESGIYNAYEIDVATGQKKALSNSAKESIFGNSYVPGSTNIIYSYDKEGNEINHLYLKTSTT